MAEAETVPEPDRVEGAPHPRHAARLVGHGAAQAELAEALASGRMPHAWLIAGPRGVGKATLAWRFARHLLAEAPPALTPAGLAPPSGQGGHPGRDGRDGGRDGGRGDGRGDGGLDRGLDPGLEARIAALSEPRLCLIRRGWDPARKRLRAVITVDEVRRLRGFFGLSAAGGGRRVVIVDSADEMNLNAANALLKVLEEPPAGAVLLLVSHQPARLLPTIRSRCRLLRLHALDPGEMAEALAAAGAQPPEGSEAVALAELSGGSVGEALRLLAQDGARLYADLVAILARMPRLDHAAVHALAETVGREPLRLELLTDLVERALSRLARAAVAGAPARLAAPDEAEMFARLAARAEAGPRWAALASELGARLRHGRAVNLDPAALILDTVLRINDLAASLPR